MDGEVAWRETGHRWLGRRVRRFFGESMSDGTIVKWVDAAPAEARDHVTT